MQDKVPRTDSPFAVSLTTKRGESNGTISEGWYWPGTTTTHQETREEKPVLVKSQAKPTIKLQVHWY